MVKVERKNWESLKAKVTKCYHNHKTDCGRYEFTVSSFGNRLVISFLDKLHYPLGKETQSVEFLEVQPTSDGVKIDILHATADKEKAQYPKTIATNVAALDEINSAITGC